MWKSEVKHMKCEANAVALPSSQIADPQVPRMSEIWYEAERPFRGLKRRGGSPLEHHHESHVHHEWLPSTWACPRGIFLILLVREANFKYISILYQVKEREEAKEEEEEAKKTPKRGRCIRRSQYIYIYIQSYIYNQKTTIQHFIPRIYSKCKEYKQGRYSAYNSRIYCDQLSSLHQDTFHSAFLARRTPRGVGAPRPRGYIAHGSGRFAASTRRRWEPSGCNGWVVGELDGQGDCIPGSTETLGSQRKYKYDLWRSFLSCPCWTMTSLIGSWE